MKDQTKEEQVYTKHLGTMAPFPPSLPPEVSQLPFDSGESVARTYCNLCGGIAEIPENVLANVLRLRALLLKTENTIPTSGEYWKNHYVLFSNGCTSCRRMEMPTIIIASNAHNAAQPAS